MVTNVMLSICVWDPTKPINKQDELHAKSYYVRKQCCQNNPWQNKFWLHCTHRLLICQHTADEELSCHLFFFLFFFNPKFGCSKVLMGKRGCGFRAIGKESVVRSRWELCHPPPQGPTESDRSGCFSTCWWGMMVGGSSAVIVKHTHNAHAHRLPHQGTWQIPSAVASQPPCLLVLLQKAITVN